MSSSITSYSGATVEFFNDEIDDVIDDCIDFAPGTDRLYSTMGQ